MAKCPRHRGLQLFEDLVIPEEVHDAYRPVPPDRTGDRLPVSMLSSSTLAVIRPVVVVTTASVDTLRGYR